MKTIKKALARWLQAAGLYPAARVMRSRLFTSEHLARAMRFYAQYVRSGDLCFDVGAHTGEVTQALVRLGATVVCIEPQEACLNELRRRFAGNGNVIIVPGAVADREGWGELAVCEEEPEISTMARRWQTESRFARDWHYQWRKTQRVPVTTLNALIKQWGLPQFCKIDVEGFEVPVLKGLEEPLPLLSYEFAIEFLDDAEVCAEHLQSLGSVGFNCVIGDSLTLEFPDWVPFGKVRDHLHAAPDRFLWGDIYARFR